jgi:NADH-quinone oxidoreductase subunit K
MTDTPQGYLLLSGALFAIGLTVAVVRKHPLVVLLGIEVALQAVSLAIAALTSSYQDWGGQVLALVLVTISAVEWAAGMAVYLAIGHRDVA